MALAPFQALVDVHGPPVHRFLRARVGPSDAEDCLQETFLSALRAYPRLPPDADVRAWLFTIAHRKAIDHVRRRARTAPVADVGELAGPATQPGLDAIWEQVAALPEKQRAAVALRFLGDLTHAQIGAAMGTSEAAARRNVHEALKRLRQEIDR